MTGVITLLSAGQASLELHLWFSRHRNDIGVLAKARANSPSSGFKLKRSGAFRKQRNGAGVPTGRTAGNAPGG